MMHDVNAAIVTRVPTEEQPSESADLKVKQF